MRVFSCKSDKVVADFLKGYPEFFGLHCMNKNFYSRSLQEFA